MRFCLLQGELFYILGKFLDRTKFDAMYDNTLSTFISIFQ